MFLYLTLKQIKSITCLPFVFLKSPEIFCERIIYKISPEDIDVCLSVAIQLPVSLFGYKSRRGIFFKEHSDYKSIYSEYDHTKMPECLLDNISGFRWNGFPEDSIPTGKKLNTSSSRYLHLLILSGINLFVAFGETDTMPILVHFHTEDHWRLFIHI